MQSIADIFSSSGVDVEEEMELRVNSQKLYTLEKNWTTTKKRLSHNSKIMG